MDQLEGTENRISVARQRYNEAVRKFNTAIKRFPARIIAGWFGYNIEKESFSSVAGAETAPDTVSYTHLTLPTN